jgi:hypothetical protein
MNVYRKGQWVVVDKQSLNGLFVNDIKTNEAELRYNSLFVSLYFHAQ